MSCLRASLLNFEQVCCPPIPIAIFMFLVSLKFLTAFATAFATIFPASLFCHSSFVEPISTKQHGFLQDKAHDAWLHKQHHSQYC